MFEEGQFMTETLEERIRERAYLIWETSGRPSGRDDELWQRAREMIGADDDQPTRKMPRRGQKRAKPAEPPRKRTRRTSPPCSSGISISAG
jgi:hypothetical protein